MDAVPATQIVGAKQKQHSGDRLAALTIRSLYLNGTALHLPRPTTFRVLLELPDGQQLFECHFLRLGGLSHSFIRRDCGRLGLQHMCCAPPGHHQASSEQTLRRRVFAHAPFSTR